MGIEIRDIEERFAERLPSDRTVAFDFSNAPEDKNDDFVEIKGTEGNTIQDTEDGWKIGGTIVGTLPTSSTAITGTTTNVNTLTPGVIYPINNAAAVKLVTTGTAKAGTFYFRIGSDPSAYNVTIGNEGLVGHSADVVFRSQDDVGKVFALYGNATDGYSLEATPSPVITDLSEAGETPASVDTDSVLAGAAEPIGYRYTAGIGGYDLQPESAGEALTVSVGTTPIRGGVMQFRIGETTANYSITVDSTDIDNLDADVVFDNGASDIGKVFSLVFAVTGNVIYIGPQEDEVNLQAPQSVTAQEADFDIGAVVTQGDLTLVPIDTNAATIEVTCDTAFRGVALCTITDTNNTVTLDAGTINGLPGDVDLVFASSGTEGVIKFMLVGDGSGCTYYPLDVDYDRLDTIDADLESLTPANITDPGNGGAIPVTDSGWCQLVSASAETRTLANPTKGGVQLDLLTDTYGGDIVITVAGPINQSLDNTITMGAEDDFISLRSVAKGPGYVWRVVANDGAAVSTVP